MKTCLKIVLFCGVLLSSSIVNAETTNKKASAIKIQVDQKNVLGQVGHIILLRSFSESFWGSDITNRTSYLDAYDLNTGEHLWQHQDRGVITSFLIIDEQKLIYRNYNAITALDVQAGRVLWTQKTSGGYSTVAGE